MQLMLKTAAALGLLLAVPALAGDYVKLKDGTPIKGEATAYDEATKSLTFKMEDGTVRTLRLDDLDGRSVYLVNHSRVPKDDFAKQLRLANFARDIGLYAHAVRHYEYAAKADPARKAELDSEIAVLKQKAAAWGMQKAKDALAKGDVAEGEKWLLKLVEKLPNEPQGKEAAALLEQYYSQTRAAKESQAQNKASDQLKKDLEPGRGYYKSMVEKTKKGLESDRAGSAAVSSFEGAIKDGERCLKELDKLSKKYSDAGTRETFDGYRNVIVGQVIEAHLHLASLLTTRSSYNKALAEVNNALALDPKSEAALSARVRIEQAASERGGWIW